MQGYQNPLVVKEIFLPIKNSSYSRDSYLKEFGIDLNDLFEYSKDDKELNVKGTNKFYVVDCGALSSNTSVSHNSVIPVVPQRLSVQGVTDLTTIYFLVPESSEDNHNIYGVRIFMDNGVLSLQYWEL